MEIKVNNAVESFTTVIAWKRFVSRMPFYMANQAAPRIEVMLAERTLE
jgi:hypothetical protein